MVRSELVAGTGLQLLGVRWTSSRAGEPNTPDIAIGEDDNRLRANANHLIVLPAAGEAINPLLSVLPLQLLSYQLSLRRGYDPDFPRNLSKTLTVD